MFVFVFVFVHLTFFLLPFFIVSNERMPKFFLYACAHIFDCLFALSVYLSVYLSILIVDGTNVFSDLSRETDKRLVSDFSIEGALINIEVQSSV